MIRFVPIERPAMDGERLRAALTSARKRVQEALGPDVEVGEIRAGGFEVVTKDPEAEERIRAAVSETAMKGSGDVALRIGSSGSLVPDQDPMDGSMIGL